MNNAQLNRAIQCLKSGGVIAYPTESVYGLGCDANNPESISRILKIKKRDANKGLILLVSDIQQAAPFISALSDPQIAKISRPNDKPTTWLLNKSSHVSPLIVGVHPKIAIRITSHPIAKALCEQLASPLISTSCNLHGKSPCKDSTSVRKYMSTQIDLIMDGECGAEAPSRIVDLETGKRIR